MINAIIILLGIAGIAMLAIVNFSTTKQNKILLKELAETRKQNILLEEKIRQAQNLDACDASKIYGHRQYKIGELVKLLCDAGFKRHTIIQMNADAIEFWFKGESVKDSKQAYRRIGEEMHFSANGGDTWASIYF